MIDIHSHVLWGIDDGPATEQDSVAMLRAAAQSGTTDIVATPHASSRYSFDIEVVRKRVESLCGHSGLPRIHIGCDFHLSPSNIEDALWHSTKYTVNSGQYLLVELPEVFSCISVNHILERLAAQEILPIITHPERNPEIQRNPKIVDDWIECGCLLQITAQSLTGRFGRRAKKLAFLLMGMGKAQFIASDAHDPLDRHARLDEAFGLVQKRFGSAYAESLFETNPRAVIDNRFGICTTAPIAVASWRKLWVR